MQVDHYWPMTRFPSLAPRVVSPSDGYLAAELDRQLDVERAANLAASPDLDHRQIGQSALRVVLATEPTGWRARHVGLVFQFYNLMPVLTAQKNV